MSPEAYRKAAYRICADAIATRRHQLFGLFTDAPTTGIDQTLMREVDAIWLAMDRAADVPETETTGA